MFQRIKSFLFENKSVKQTVIKNAIWLTGGSIISRLIKAVMIIYAARVLGTEGYGIFSYALSLAAFFTIFSDIGLSGLLTRELVKKPNEIQRYTSTTFYIKLVITSLSVLFTLFAAPLFIKIDIARPLLPIVAFLLAFDSLRAFTFSITRSKNRMEIESMLSVLTDILITCFGFVALFLLPTPKWLSIAYTAGSGLGLIIAFVVIRKWAGDFIKGFDRTLIKPLLSSAWPFAVMGLLGGLMINIDTIIIGWFRSANELGLYAAAQRPILLFYIVPSLISTSIFPIISKFAHEGDHNRTKKILEQTIIGSLAIGIPLIVGGMLLGQSFTQFVFGSAYIDATLTFQLLLLTIVPVFVGAIIGNAIFAYDKQKIFLISVGAGALVNVIFDLILIPTYGIAGSAVATIIAQLISNGYVWWRFKEVVDLDIIPKLGRITLASIGMGLAVLSANLLHLHVIFSIIIGIIVYAALIIALKEPFLEIIGWKPKKCIMKI